MRIVGIVPLIAPWQNTHLEEWKLFLPEPSLCAMFKFYHQQSMQLSEGVCSLAFSSFASPWILMA